MIETSNTATQGGDPAPVAGSPPRLLVVDDQPVYIQTLFEIFHRDHEVFFATSGLQALEICHSNQPDLILLDVLMPGMDGLEVCRLLKDDPVMRDIPVIIVTAQENPEDETRGLEAGAVDFITKPVNPTVVRARVKTQLTLKAQADQLRAANEEMIVKNGELQNARKQAETANRVKSAFLANMSHELRTPLNATIGFTDVVLSKSFGPLNGDQEEYLGYVLQSSRHLLELINDILDLSKVESGKMEIDLSDVMIRKMLSNSLVMVKELAHRRDVQLLEEFAVDLPVTVRVDERKLKQIVYNLLSNAIKFTRAGGSVTVVARTSGDISEFPPDVCEVCTGIIADSGQFLLITVSDTGLGLKQEDLKRIFNPFEQADNSETRDFEGTGLGLALTRKLLELHGGAIWAESGGLNKGSTFHIILPV